MLLGSLNARETDRRTTIKSQGINSSTWHRCPFLDAIEQKKAEIRRTIDYSKYAACRGAETEVGKIENHTENSAIS